MSNFAVESFLYDLQSLPGMMQDFAKSPQTVLDRYVLTAEERADIVGWNVRAIAERGVSHMLLALSYCAVHGIEARLEYIRLLQQPALQSSVTA